MSAEGTGRKPFEGRAPFLVFIGIVLFSLAQLTWWIVLLRGHGAEAHGETIRRVQAECIAATAMLARLGPVDEAAAGALLDRHFPHLRYNPDLPADRLPPGVGSLHLSGGVEPRPEWAAEQEARLRRRIIMFASEASFFIVVLLAGFAVVYRAYNRELLLKRQQVNFVNMVSHELATPLATIQVYLETLRRRAAGREDILETAAVLRDETRRLNAMVDNLLFAGRFQRGAFAIHPEDVDLSERTRRAANLAREQAERMGGGLELDVADGVMLRADRAAIESILSNLLQNALKYGGANPRIRAGLRAENGFAVLTVSDQGIGVPAEELPRLFQMFHRAGGEKVRERPGSGLGLYLVRQFARAHGGEVTAASEGPGKGAVFTVRLPLRPQGLA